LDMDSLRCFVAARLRHMNTKQKAIRREEHSNA
jgi:hypothetical protein